MSADWWGDTHSMPTGKATGGPCEPRQFKRKKCSACGKRRWVLAAGAPGRNLGLCGECST